MCCIVERGGEPIGSETPTPLVELLLLHRVTQDYKDILLTGRIVDLLREY